MKISTKGRYGLRALIDLGVNSRGKPVLLREIAQRQDISRRYLERLFSELKSAGVIRSIRGALGGYILSREPRAIIVSEVLEALEGPLLPVDCVSNKSVCDNMECCVTHDVWTDIARQIKTYFDNITLEDLMENYRKKRALREIDFQI